MKYVMPFLLLGVLVVAITVPVALLADSKLDVWDVFVDPSWIMAGLTFGVGIGGLAAILLLYPLGRD